MLISLNYAIQTFSMIIDLPKVVEESGNPFCKNPSNDGVLKANSDEFLPQLLS